MKPVKGKISQITTHNKEYKIVTNPSLCEPYYEDGSWNWHHGNMPNHKWREHRIWKYNRKTKWK